MSDVAYSVVRVSGDDRDARRWATRVAVLTRAAFARSDPLPGLPAPDGARDTAATVLADLRRSGSLWLALRRDGGLVGTLRTIAHPDNTWEISKVAVAPAVRRGGVARTLLDAVEAAAPAQRSRVWLHAVVERCLPPVYARLGYRIAEHFPAGDKPLCEVTMRRPAHRPPRDPDLPWPARLGEYRYAVCWFLAAARLIAVVVPADDLGVVVGSAANRLAAEGFTGARLAGVDVTSREAATAAGVPPLDRTKGDVLDRYGAATAVAEDIRMFDGGRLAVPGHLLPRCAHPSLLALWRYAPGREAAVSPGSTT